MKDPENYEEPENTWDPEDLNDYEYQQAVYAE